jgi:cardiolipin synthase A/B
VSTLAKVITIAFSVYAVVAIIFLISENRRPQATLAWALAFFFMPGLGLLIYILFGRDWKAFSKQRQLLLQDLKANAYPLLSPIIAGQDQVIARLEAEGHTHSKLMMLVRRNSRSVLTGRNTVEILQDAAAFYPRLMEDLQAARHSIHLQYFIWGADDFTEQIKAILVAKARAGVTVRLLFDPIGSHAHLNRTYLRDMRADGIQVSPTSPLYHLHTISYRNHRKITVIDGTIGFTGGMNIGREHLCGGKGFASWRDTQVRVMGEAAAVLQSVFMVDWYNAVKENLFDRTYFPTVGAEPTEGDVSVQILTSGPDSQWSAIRQLYFAMITSAQRHVYIQSPYFILDATIAEALSAAALAGVKVHVMLTERASGDPVPGWASNTYVLDVVAAGVRVFLYEKGYLHAKTISVDSEICSIGSTNIDIRSFSINYEINAVIYSKQKAIELEDAFERDLAHCNEFNPAEYLARSPLVRFRDSTARLLSPLL